MAAKEEEELTSDTERLITTPTQGQHDRQFSDEFELIEPINFRQPFKEICCRCQGKFTMLLASIMAALGGVLFGYDIGIVSGAVLQLRQEFKLNCFQQEMVVSSMLMGAVIASLSGGFIIDYLGRRLAIIINSVIFLTGAIILAAAHSYPVLVIGRLIVGFGVSLSSTAECTYISEIAPARWRGMLVSLNELGICLGLLVAYLVSYIFIDVDSGWRYMFGLSGIPAVIQGVGMFFLPQSPRWLIVKGEDTKACSSIQELHWSGDPYDEMNKIKSGLHRINEYKLKDLFSKKNNMRQRILIGGGVVFFQQITGQPTVVYYASTIFQVLGFESRGKATLAALSIGLAKLMATIASLLTVDRGGRRRFLLISSSVMTVSILVLGILVHYRPAGHQSSKCQYSYPVLNTTHPTPISNHSGLLNVTSNTTHLASHPPLSPAVRYLSLVALVTFVGGYSFGYGPVSWLLLSEIFPAAIKGRAFSFTTTLNYGTNLIVSLTFLDLISSLGISGTFIMSSCIGVLAMMFIYKYVPETKNRTLEQISAQLNSRETKNLCPQFVIEGVKWLTDCNSIQRRRPFNTGSASEILLSDNAADT